MVVIVHPSRLKATAEWIVENLLETQYPGIDHFPNDPTTIAEHITKSEWEEIAWFDHRDTVVQNTLRSSGFGHIEDQRTPRRHHLIFEDEQAWVMVKLLQ